MAGDECIEFEFEFTPKAFREYAKYLVEQGEAEDSESVNWANRQAEALEERSRK